MDKLLIRDLRLSCILGTREEERRQPQEVLVNLTLSVHLENACRSDRLEDTVDYSALTERIVTLVRSSSFYLIEGLAGAIAELCLDDPGVEQVQVRLEKPGALPSASSAAVEITRG